MADYYPLLLRAISAQPSATYEYRLLIYDRARKALTRSLAPTPTYLDIEIASFDRAIERIEWEVRNENSRNQVDATYYFKSIKDLLDRLSDKTSAERQAILMEYADLFRESLLRRRPSISPSRISEQYSKLLVMFDDLERELSQKRSAQLDIERLSARLVETASPQSKLDQSGKLDAGSNTIYDAATGLGAIRNLPNRQIFIVHLILEGLPANGPKHVRYCLSRYEDELRLPVSQLTIGLLQDMASIIDEDFKAQVVGYDWLEPGVKKAFHIFLANHEALISNYPLSAERERLYKSTNVADDVDLYADTMNEPMEKVSKAAVDAMGAGIATERFVNVIDELAESLKIIASMPLAIGIKDQHNISSKKRVILSALGFFIGAYNIVGSTASIFGAAQLIGLFDALKEAIAILTSKISL